MTKKRGMFFHKLFPGDEFVTETLENDDVIVVVGY